MKGPVYIFTIGEFILNKKNIQGMMSIFYILSEKNRLFLREGGRPPPLLGDKSTTKSSFFLRPP